MFEDEFIVFKTVAETNNITLAAKRLHISQPAISLQIQNIENYYGVKFFVRSNKGVTLTVAGKVFYKYVCNMLEMLEKVQREIGKLSGESRGEVRIGATLTIGDYVVPDILMCLSREKPNIDFNVKIANTEMIAQEVLERKLRIGLVEGPVPDAHGLVVESFWQDELMVVVPRHHPWVEKGSVSLAELAETNLILREVGSGTRKVIEQFLRQQGRALSDFKVAMELGSMQSIKKVVVAGLGVSILSSLTIQKRHALKAVKIEGMEMKREFSIVTNSANIALTNEELYFIDRLRDRSWLAKILGNLDTDKEPAKGFFEMEDSTAGAAEKLQLTERELAEKHRLTEKDMDD
ncbi:MAG: LysR family transcriptional regulator [Peptococcaceae bacterium]|nr:LysR family transcriptional regulator [Peptococcaceae bacterium]